MIRAVSQSCQGATLGAGIALALTYDFLQFRRQQSTDGIAFLSSYDADFPQDFGVNFEGYVGFHGSHVSVCCTIMRAQGSARQLLFIAPLLSMP